MTKILVCLWKSQVIKFDELVTLLCKAEETAELFCYEIGLWCFTMLWLACDTSTVCCPFIWCGAQRRPATMPELLRPDLTHPGQCVVRTFYHSHNTIQPAPLYCRTGALCSHLTVEGTNCVWSNGSPRKTCCCCSGRVWSRVCNLVSWLASTKPDEVTTAMSAEHVPYIVM